MNNESAPVSYSMRDGKAMVRSVIVIALVLLVVPGLSGCRGCRTVKPPGELELEQAGECVQRGGNAGQGDQCWNTAARQDAVIDLHHEERTSQHQNIDDAAE